MRSPDLVRPQSKENHRRISGRPQRRALQQSDGQFRQCTVLFLRRGHSCAIP
jgi:hypothetical protein